MNSKTWPRIIALTLFATLAMPASLAAQDKAKQHHPHQYHHYQLIDPGTFGGPASYNESIPPESIINDRGAAVGGADTSAPDPFPNNCFGYIDCFVTVAYVWQDGVLTDLGALTAGYSSFAYTLNARGEVVGVSENGQIDPLTGNYEASAVLWKNGIVNLGTLGGNQSVANAITDRGQVAGAALNTISDPFANIPLPGCVGAFGVTFAQCFLFVPAATQSHAFRWTEAGGMQDLGTLGGPDSSASFVNQRGQIAGESFTSFTPNSSTGVPTLDPFFWENGKMVDIGTLGGTLGIPNWMNNHGQVVGFSNIAGDQLSHAFLWDRHHRPSLTDLGTLGGSYSNATSINDQAEIVGSANLAGDQGADAVLWKNGTIIDLGTVAGDACGQANWINSQRQIVGFGSADCNNEDHAFLWENGGPIVDLQTLVLPGSGVTLIDALFINDQGEIAARGNTLNGIQHAVLLIPCDENHPGVAGCDYDLIDTETAAARSSQNPAQHPEALTPGTRTPGMLNRFHFPINRPTPGLAPAPVAMALSATPATRDLLGDHQLVPQFGTPASYCEITAAFEGVLTGGCFQSTSPNTCHITLTGCNDGQPATFGSSLVCSGSQEHLLSTTQCGSVPGFNVSTTGLTPTTVSVGGSATTTVTVSAYGGFGDSVAFSCSVQPAPTLAPTCLFSPRSVTSGTPSTLTVSTTAPTSALRTGSGSRLFYALFLPFGGLFAMVLRFGPQQKRNGKFTAAVLACMLFGGVVFQAACGAKTPTPGTPAGSYMITVTGTDSSGTLAIPTSTVFYVQ